MSDMNNNSKPLQARHGLLGIGLAVTLAATLWAAQAEGDDADEAAGVQAVAGERRAAAPIASPAPSEAAPAVTDWNPVQRPAWAAVTPADMAGWSPPPAALPPAPPPPVAAAPVAPMAPPFPYQLIGRMEEPGAAEGSAVPVAFLSGPLRSLGVRAGELIDGQWRVDQISPAGVSLTWLPAQLKQTIAFRPASP